jgi:enoyl-CoA hydratase/carnithine racemase
VTQVLNYREENGVGWIEINRPEKKNAVDEAVKDRLQAIVESLDRRPGDVRSIILTAAGDVFCAGGDLDYFSRLDQPAARTMSERMTWILDRLWQGPQVVIGAIGGLALGGGAEIVTACHIPIAASNASFQFVHAANGLITGWGGGVRLIQNLGRARALRLLLTADRIDAKEALTLGLVSRVVPPERLQEEARALAGKIATWDPGTTQSFLELARALSEDPTRARQLETDLFAERWGSEVFKEILKSYQKED